MTLLVIVKVTLLFGAALLVARVARHAQSRHTILAGAQLAALAIPLLAFVVPPLAVTTPAASRAIVVTPGPVIENGEVVPASAPVRRRSVDVLALVWLAGCAVVSARKAMDIVRAFAIVRRSCGDGLQPVAGGGEGRPHIRYSDDIDQPSTLGRWILLPRSAQTWSAERLRAVLLHEQAHVARHDTLLGLLGDAACAVYWFHPLAWLVARRARLERERACDDRVLVRGVTADVYATAMLDVARSIARRSAAAMPMADRSQLEQRIRAILDPAVPRRAPRTAGFVIIVAILAAAPLLAAITPNAVRRPQATEPDLNGDAVASPFSERVTPAAPLSHVEATGPDAWFIALMSRLAQRTPQSDIDFVAERARWALTQMRDGELVAPLIESLDDPDWRIRAYAAWALGYSRDRRATKPLITLLEEPIWRVRAMAAHSLANLEDRASDDAMLARLDDPAWQVRTEVVRYLAGVGGYRSTVEAMLSDRHLAVRTAAHDGLNGR